MRGFAQGIFLGRWVSLRSSFGILKYKQARNSYCATKMANEPTFSGTAQTAEFTSLRKTSGGGLQAGEGNFGGRLVDNGSRHFPSDASLSVVWQSSKCKSIAKKCGKYPKIMLCGG